MEMVETGFWMLGKEVGNKDIKAQEKRRKEKKLNHKTSHPKLIEGVFEV